MERALAVVDPTESSADLVEEAGELAAGVGASLVVFSPLTAAEYEDDAAVLSTIEDVEGTSIDKDPDRIATRSAERYADDHLSGTDVEYEALGAVVEDGDRADAILEAAEGEGCDYVFLVGKRRSPTGKALFGDAAQAVILNFDGRVVVTAE